MICQGESFTRNVSLVIFPYTLVVILLFIIIKKLQIFKCFKHPGDVNKIRSASKEIVEVKNILSRPESCLGEFQVRQILHDNDYHQTLEQIFGLS